MSEVLENELPEEWVMGKIQDLITIRNGFAFKSKDFQDKAGAPVIRQTNLSTEVVNFKKPKYLPVDFLDEHSDFKVQKGDVLIGLSGSIGNLSRYIEDNPALQNQRTGLLVEQFPGATRFVQYYLQLIKIDLLAAAKGVAVQNISSKTIENWQMPIPPLEQQKRIVAKIEELFSHIDAGIEALNKAKQLLKQYRQSVLKAAVTGELTKEWREQNKDKLEPASQLLERILQERRQKWQEQQLAHFKAKGKMPKNDKWKEKYKELDLISAEELKSLPKLPVGWCYTRLGNVIEDPKYGTSKKCSYDTKGLGVLRIPNVSNGRVDATDLKFADFDDKERNTYKLKEGDILTIRSNGSVNLVGKCAQIKNADEEYLYAGYLIRLRPFIEIVSSQYLINSLNSIYLRKQIGSKAKSTSGVNNINSGELQSLVIAVCSREEQEEVSCMVDFKLSAVEKLVYELELDLVKAEQNKQSILSSAFSGHLEGSKVTDGDAAQLLKLIDKREEPSKKRAVKKSKKPAGTRNIIWDIEDVIWGSFNGNDFTLDELIELCVDIDEAVVKKELFEAIKINKGGKIRLEMRYDGEVDQYVFNAIKDGDL